MTKEQEIILKINEMNFLLTGEAKEKYSSALQEVLSMLKEKDEKIEYYRKQKDYDMRFRRELLEEIKCLNLDKDEKDKEIDELKQTLARNIARNVTSSMKESVKSKEDLEMLNAGWQIELEKKDKIIDLMARAFKQDDVRTVEEIIEYFTELVAKE